MLKMVIGLNRGWGRSWSWQAFRIVWCHTILSMQMAEASCGWYCVTLVLGSGNDVIMVCWKDWRLSASFSSPQAHCKSCCLVIRFPVAFRSDQPFGSCWMRALIWWSLFLRASMSCDIVGDWSCVEGSVVLDRVRCFCLFVFFEVFRGEF